MIRRLAVFAVLPLLAAPLAAATLESASALGRADFQAAALLPLKALPPAAAPQLSPREVMPAPAQAQGPKARWTHVAGYLTLSGSAVVPGRPPTMANVYLTGWLTVSDASGRVSSQSMFVGDWAYVYVTGPGGVFYWANPRINVTLYEDGRVVGSGEVTGTIPVSGSAWDGGLSLSGSGQVSGDVWLQEPAR